ncbi:hypothetical protein B7486_71755, partial [cyanobacterium TDX16]
MPVEQQVVSIAAGTGGYLDGIPVGDVGRFEADLLEWVSTRHADLLAGIRDSGKVDDDELTAVLDAFAAQFVTSDGKVGTMADAEDIDEELVEAGGRAEGILPEVEIKRDDEDEA